MRAWLFSLMAMMFFALLAVGWSFSIWQHAPVQKRGANLSPEQSPLVIASGTGTRVILAQLHEAGYLPAPWKIVLPYGWFMRHRSLKAGEYVLDAGLSPAEILDKIARGEVVQHKITLPEGWTSRQWRAALMAESLLTGELPNPLPEGQFLPDTRRFTRNQPRSALLEQMRQAMETTLREAWEHRAPNLPLASPDEALILASIIEKETGLAHERPMVAAVFINRLRIGMRLQTDPSVAYGVAAQGLSRPLTRADLAADTPYNSYTRTGLPPTPICNPGKASIQAALHPADTQALYFVATGQGGHRFATSLAEHAANVRAYRAAMQAQP